MQHHTEWLLQIVEVCRYRLHTHLDQPDSITLSILENQANCTNLPDGSIDVTASGGTGEYSYFWTGENGYTSFDEDPSGLSIGQYFVTVLDENGCSINDTALITEVNIINANAGADTTVCELDSVILTGSGGILYSWSDGGTTQNPPLPQPLQPYILNVFNNGVFGYRYGCG